MCIWVAIRPPLYHDATLKHGEVSRQGVDGTVVFGQGINRMGKRSHHALQPISSKGLVYPERVNFTQLLSLVCTSATKRCKHFVFHPNGMRQGMGGQFDRQLSNYSSVLRRGCA